ncbi:phosphoesterase [Myxococcota bacterium]|nr:phosphoesterase [Myxococcota bacterium]
MEDIDVYDELQVVSDLHLGGPSPDFQIFDQGDLLARVIRSAAAGAAGRRVGLVLNGDIVDFLAQGPRPGQYLDVPGALSKFDAIRRDPAFSPVFDALSAFARSPGCHLVLALGNHDVELALPDVRHRLIRTLCDGPGGPDDATEAARGRLRIALDGAGYACRVGPSRVLCVHGNTADDWNIVDRGALAETSAAVLAGAPPPPWPANAGTRLVVDVMNAVKARYPFVDLLKPEIEAVFTVLFALDWRLAARIGDVGRLAAHAALDRRRLPAVLGADPGLEGTGGEESPLLARAARRIDEAGGSSPAPEGGSALLDEVDDMLRRGVDPVALAGEEEGGYDTLGVGDALAGIGRSLWGRVQGLPDHERVRRALLGLADDRSFDPSHEDEVFRALDGATSPDLDFVVAGHTHLRRALRRPSGGIYFNTGTWARLIHLKPAMLQDPAAFVDVWEGLRAPTLRRLDAARVRLGVASDLPLVMRSPTVVRIRATGGRVVGELCLAAPQGEGASLLPSPGGTLAPARG